MTRDRRAVSTPSMAPMPVSRKTGATASWITLAMAEMAGSGGMGLAQGVRAFGILPPAGHPLDQTTARQVAAQINP